MSLINNVSIEKQTIFSFKKLGLVLCPYLWFFKRVHLFSILLVFSGQQTSRSPNVKPSISSVVTASNKQQQAQQLISTVTANQKKLGKGRTKRTMPATKTTKLLTKKEQVVPGSSFQKGNCFVHKFHICRRFKLRLVRFQRKLMKIQKV